MAETSTSSIVAAVDDDPGVLRSLGYLLQSADYAARLFTTGTAFIESGCLREIDCLISDIDMPAIDGFELLRQVRATRPGLPTVLITGYPDTLTQLPRSVGGVARVFIKPFNGTELLAAVREAIGRGESSSA